MKKVSLFIVLIAIVVFFYPKELVSSIPQECKCFGIEAGWRCFGMVHSCVPAEEFPVKN